jgi:hypothetical protein
VVLVVDLDDAPWIDSSANLATIRSPDDLVRSHDSKGDFARDFLGLRKGFFVLVVICGRLEDVDVVERDIRKYLGSNGDECKPKRGDESIYSPWP